MTSKPIASDATPMILSFQDGPFAGKAFQPSNLHFGQVTAIIAHKGFMGYYAVPNPNDTLASWATRAKWHKFEQYHSLHTVLHWLGRKQLPVLPAWWVHEGLDWPPELVTERRLRVLEILDEWYEKAKRS